MLRACMLLLFLGIMPIACSTHASTVSNAQAESQPVFRKPFVLKLAIDSQHYYEEKFKPIPYVADNTVYLFSGESFGINCAVNGDQITGIVYQPDLSKADVTFHFKQLTALNGRFMMLLTTQNTLKRPIQFDALMTVPGSKDIHKTNVLPVEAGLASFESWPHPIVQLALRNFRFHVPPKSAKADMEMLKALLKSGTATKVQVVHLSDSTETYTAVTPQSLRTLAETTKAFDQNLAETFDPVLSGIVVKPVDHPADLRWGVLFYDAKGHEIAALFVDKFGHDGYLNGEMVSFDAGASGTNLAKRIQEATGIPRG